METWPNPTGLIGFNTVCPLSHCGSPWARSGQHQAGHWGPACHSETMSSALYCMSKVLLLHWFSCFSFTSPLGFCIWGQNRQSGAERRRKSQGQWSPGKVWHFLHPVLSGWPLIFENGRCHLCHNADLLDPVRRWRGWLLQTRIWKEGGEITGKILMIWLEVQHNPCESSAETLRGSILLWHICLGAQFHPCCNQAHHMSQAFYITKGRSFAFNCFQLLHSAISPKEKC